MIGSPQRAPGWQSFDIAAGPEVDHVGDCRDLSRFADNSIEAIYASHVLEHLSRADVLLALREWRRVLRPGSDIMISVPDLNIVAQIFISPKLRGPEKYDVLSMIYGGQIDSHDYHLAGFDLEILTAALHDSGFNKVTRVPNFGLLADSSALVFHGVAISLNVRAEKPGR